MMEKFLSAEERHAIERIWQFIRRQPVESKSDRIARQFSHMRSVDIVGEPFPPHDTPIFVGLVWLFMILPEGAEYSLLEAIYIDKLAGYAGNDECKVYFSKENEQEYEHLRIQSLDQFPPQVAYQKNEDYTNCLINCVIPNYQLTEEEKKAIQLIVEKLKTPLPEHQSMYSARTYHIIDVMRAVPKMVADGIDVQLSLYKQFDQIGLLDVYFDSQVEIENTHSLNPIIRRFGEPNEKNALEELLKMSASYGEKAFIRAILSQLEPTQSLPNEQTDHSSNQKMLTRNF